MAERTALHHWLRGLPAPQVSALRAFRREARKLYATADNPLQAALSGPPMLFFGEEAETMNLIGQMPAENVIQLNHTWKPEKA